MQSTLMSKLTGTHSEASEIDFTTLTTIPGTLKVHGAPIQILDLREYVNSLILIYFFTSAFEAGIIEGANDNRGRGRQGKPYTCFTLYCYINDIQYSSHCRYGGLQLFTIKINPAKNINSVARTCNLIFIVLDVLKPLGDKRIIESELEGFGIRLNKRPPSIIVRKKEKGGIAITNTVPLTNIDQDEIKAILSEYRINNADIAIREPGATADDLVDVIEGNRYMEIYTVTKY